MDDIKIKSHVLVNKMDEGLKRWDERLNHWGKKIQAAMDNPNDNSSEARHLRRLMKEFTAAMKHGNGKIRIKVKL